MKAITVKQPFAALIAAGAKRTENREFRPLSVLTTRGKRLAIHAGKYKPTVADIEEARRLAREDSDISLKHAKRVLGEDRESWAYQRVVAVVTVGEPRPDGNGGWRWPLSDVRAATSAEVRGQQRLFDIPTRQIRYVS
ncbi:MAG: hypothetical protein F4X11_20405 [Acidobacteria bacterium]|nr:hypothetical protein [Acidobacteriota bacterium]